MLLSVMNFKYQLVSLDHRHENAKFDSSANSETFRGRWLSVLIYLGGLCQDGRARCGSQPASSGTLRPHGFWVINPFFGMQLGDSFMAMTMGFLPDVGIESLRLL